MPYEIRRVSPRKYEVVNPVSGEVHAKHTSLAKAKAQVRLLSSKHGGMINPDVVRRARDAFRALTHPNEFLPIAPAPPRPNLPDIIRPIAIKPETDPEPAPKKARKGTGRTKKAIIKELRKDIVHHKGEHRPSDYLRDAIKALSGSGVIQPINPKPSRPWFSGGGMTGGDYIQPINQKVLPFF